MVVVVVTVVVVVVGAAVVVGGAVVVDGAVVVGPVVVVGGPALVVEGGSVEGGGVVGGVEDGDVVGVFVAGGATAGPPVEVEGAAVRGGVEATPSSTGRAPSTGRVPSTGPVVVDAAGSSDPDEVVVGDAKVAVVVGATRATPVPGAVWSKVGGGGAAVWVVCSRCSDAPMATVSPSHEVAPAIPTTRRARRAGWGRRRRLTLGRSARFPTRLSGPAGSALVA